MDSMGEKYVSEGIKSNNQERLGVLAAPREVRSTFLFNRAELEDDHGTAALIEMAGGGVEEGEDLQTAVKRELKEELGVDADVLCRLGVVSDYYNLIHRHNITCYFLCRITSFGEKDLTEEEKEVFHLSTLKMKYEEAAAEYELRRETGQGRLIANRELPVLLRAREIIGREEKVIYYGN